MTLDDFEKCEGKPQSKNCCVKPEPTRYIYNDADYSDDDDYFRHIAYDSARYGGFPGHQKRN